MGRIGDVTAPVKCEENARAPIEIKQEPCRPPIEIKQEQRDDEDAYGESHPKRPAGGSRGKPPSSSLSAAETENYYEFLGHMKYEPDESAVMPTTGPPSFLPTTAKRPSYLSTTAKRPSYLPTTAKRPSYLPTTGPPSYLPTTAKRPSYLSTTAKRPSYLPTTAKRPSYLPTTAEFPFGLPTTEEGWADLLATEPPSSNMRAAVCPFCQQNYGSPSRTGYPSKQEFVAHLIKAHNCGHLHGYCCLHYCKRCDGVRPRWSFVVAEGGKYKFSDACNQCQLKIGLPRWAGTGLQYVPSGVERCLVYTGVQPYESTDLLTTEPPCDLPTTEPPSDSPTTEPLFDWPTTEPPPSSKRYAVCPLCQHSYGRASRSGGHSKQDFVVHLVKAHDYRHLGEPHRPACCTRCDAVKQRWSFVVAEGDNYKVGDVCSGCQIRKGRLVPNGCAALAWYKYGPAGLNAELRECPEATAETPSESEEPSTS